MYASSLRAVISDSTSTKEYTREDVLVHPLGRLTPLSSTPIPPASILGSDAVSSTMDSYVSPLKAPELPPLDTLSPPLAAQTYIFAGPLRGLSPELWSYEDFVRENAWKWVGRGTHEVNYAEVDRRRELDGKTLRTEIVPGSGTETMSTEVHGALAAVEVAD